MTTAVWVTCQQRDKVAELRPFPAAGPTTSVDVVRRAARYRPGLADYITKEPAGHDGWVTIPALSVRLPMVEFNSPTEWSERFSASWACRCGTVTLSHSQVVDAFYAWLVERSKTGYATARVVLL